MSDTSEWTPQDAEELERRIKLATTNIKCRRLDLKNAKLHLEDLKAQTTCDHSLELDYRVFVIHDDATHETFVCTKCGYKKFVEYPGKHQE